MTAAVVIPLIPLPITMMSASDGTFSLSNRTEFERFLYGVCFESEDKAEVCVSWREKDEKGGREKRGRERCIIGGLVREKIMNMEVTTRDGVKRGFMNIM